MGHKKLQYLWFGGAWGRGKAFALEKGCQGRSGDTIVAGKFWILLFSFEAGQEGEIAGTERDVKCGAWR